MNQVLSLNSVISVLKMLAFSFAGSLFIALMSQISVPMFPVPMTMQTYGVLLVGGLLGAKAGFLALSLYLIEGICGLPVFAGGSCGLGAMLGATGGYLLGMPFSAFATGFIVERLNRNRFYFLKTLLAGFCGLIPVYVLGIFVLKFYVSSFSQALVFGFYPFLLGCSLKVVLFASCMKLFKR